MPLINDIFDLVKDNEKSPEGTLMHIELKVPDDPKIKANYRFKEAAQKLEQIINDYDLGHMSMVQSFDHEILGEFENFNKNQL